MPRVVFDTVVFVRSLLNPYGRWGRLVFRHADAYRLVLSPPLLSELLEVLTRPELTAKFRTTEAITVASLLALIEGQAEIVELPQIPLVSRDPKDDKVLATARAAQAAYLVTEDQDLLVLGTFEGTQILTATAFLQILEEHEGDEQ